MIASGYLKFLHIHPLYASLSTGLPEIVDPQGREEISDRNWRCCKVYLLMVSTVCCLVLCIFLLSLETAARLTGIQAVWTESWGNISSRRGRFSMFRCVLVWYFLGGKCAHHVFFFSLVHAAERITVFHRAQRNFGLPTGSVCIKSDTDHACGVSVMGTWNSAVHKTITAMLFSTTVTNHWPSKTRNVSVSI